MNIETLVSIIVPIYKVEAYLPLCMNSLLNQTYQNLQIVLVDDGSPDGSSKICDDYAKKDTRIKVIHQENAGVSVARNVGLKEAVGKYLMFVDPDDTILPTACAELVQRAEKCDADLVAANISWIDETSYGVQNVKKRIVKHTIVSGVLDGQEYLLKQIQNGTYLASVCINLYRRIFLLEHAAWFMAGTRCEDAEWVPRVFCAAQRVAQIETPFYQYRLRNESAMHDENVAVLRTKDFLNKICPANERTLQSVSPELRECFLQYSFRECMVKLVETKKYFSKHKNEINFSFLKKCGNDGKVKIWLILLQLNVFFFSFVWRLRGKLKYIR